MKSNFKQGVRKITSLLLVGVLTLSAIPGSSLTTYASSVSEETTSTEVTVDSSSETIVVGDTEDSDTTTVISNSSEDETSVTDDATDISSHEIEEATSELSEDTEVSTGYASIEVIADTEDSETTDLSSIVYDVYSDDECTKSVGSFALSYDGKAYVSLPDMEESEDETTELVDTVYYDSESLEGDLNASIKYLELESGTIYYAQMNEFLYDSDDTVDSKDVIYNDSLTSFTVTSENVTTDTAYVIKISIETSEKATSEEGNSTEDEESSDDDGDPEPESSSEETTEASEDITDSTETTIEATTEDIIYVEAVSESESLVSAEPVVIAAGTLGSLSGTTESGEESESSETELNTATMTDGEESTIITDNILVDTEDTDATKSTDATEDEENSSDVSSEDISAESEEITGTLTDTNDTATTTDAENEITEVEAVSGTTSFLSTVSLFYASPSTNKNDDGTWSNLISWICSSFPDYNTYASSLGDSACRYTSCAGFVSKVMDCNSTFYPHDSSMYTASCGTLKSNLDREKSNGNYVYARSASGASSAHYYNSASGTSSDIQTNLARNLCDDMAKYLEPGDIVLFQGSSGNYVHAVIYAGEGNDMKNNSPSGYTSKMVHCNGVGGQLRTGYSNASKYGYSVYWYAEELAKKYTSSTSSLSLSSLDEESIASLYAETAFVGYIAYRRTEPTTPDPGYLRIRKRADDNTIAGAEGAVFTIYVQDSKSGTSTSSSRKVATAKIGGDDYAVNGSSPTKYAVSEWKTFTCSYLDDDEQDLVKAVEHDVTLKSGNKEQILQLPAGHYYYIVETSVPTGYDAADPETVKITESDTPEDPEGYFALNSGTVSDKASGKFTLLKVSSKENVSENNSNYNFAGVTYGVYSTYDSDSKTVSDRTSSTATSTSSVAINHITLSWDGNAYMDEDGYNVVFVSKAAKKAYKATYGKVRKFKWWKKSLTADYSCYLQELSNTWSGSYTGTSYDTTNWATTAGYCTYWYDDGNYTSAISAQAGKSVAVASGHEVNSQIYRILFDFTEADATAGTDAYVTVKPFKGATGTTSSGTTSGNGTGYATLEATDTAIYGLLSLAKYYNEVNSSYDLNGAIYNVYYAETWAGFSTSSSSWVNVGYFTTLVNSSNEVIGIPYTTTKGSGTYGISAVRDTNTSTAATLTNYFTNLPIGYYVIQEESPANSGYQVNDYRWFMIVSDGGITATNSSGTGVTLAEGVYMNRVNTSISSMGAGIANGIVTGTTGTEDCYQYQTGNGMKCTITASQNPDPPVYGALSLYKTSSIDPSYLDSDYYDMTDAIFTVTDSSGTTVGTFKTYTTNNVTIGVPTYYKYDGNGDTSTLTTAANYILLPLGTYTVKETSPPKSGYKANDTKWTVTVTQDVETGEVTTTLYKNGTSNLVASNSGTGTSGDRPKVTIGLAYTTWTDSDDKNNNVDPVILGGLQLIKTANKGEQTSIDVSYLKGLKFYVYKTTGNGGSYSSSDLVATYTHTGNSTTPWSISLSSTYVSRYSSKYDNATGKITDIPLGWYVVVEDTDIANDKGTSGANIEYVEVTRDWEEKIEEVSFDNPFTALTLTKTYDLALVDGMSNYSKKGAIYKVYVVSGDGVEPDSSSNYVCTFTTNEDGVGIVTDVGTFTADGNTYNYKIATTNVTNDTIKEIAYGAWVAIVEVPTTKTSGSAGCYIADTEWRHVTSDTKTVEFTSKETVHRDNLKISLQKVDLETGKAVPQGDATLEGAEFTIKYYDVDPEKYTTADSVSSLTPTKTWVYVTNENGKIEFADETYLKSEDSDTLYYDNDGSIIVPLGVITIEETKAPTGYLLDNKYIEQTDGSIMSDENGIVCIPIKMYQYLGDYVESDYCYYGTFVASNTPLEVTAYDIVKRGGFHIEKRDEETKEKSPNPTAL